MNQRNPWMITLLVLAILVPGTAIAKDKDKDKDKDKVKGATHVVVGLEDMSVDAANIQAAFDAAAHGDSVVLEGTFQLDGTLLELSKDILLRGLAIDNDGDGAVNEDWADGIDNDGDLAVDEDDWDTVLRGLDDGTGNPLDTPVFDGKFNRAIRVSGGEDVLKNLVIRDIKFDTFLRGISINPGTNGEWLCDDLVFTAGEVHKAEIRGNWFHNSTRGFQIFGGPSDGVVVSGNVFSINDRDILLADLDGLCDDGTGGEVTFPQAPVTATEITGNLFVDDGVNRFREGHANHGVDAIGIDRLRVTANTFIGKEDLSVGAFPFALATFVENCVDCRIEDNTYLSNEIGFVGFGDLTGTLVRRNSVEDSFIGIDFDGFATGATASMNTFMTSSAVDYFLGATTTGNTIILDDPAITVADNGTGNTIQIE